MGVLWLLCRAVCKILGELLLSVLITAALLAFGFAFPNVIKGVLAVCAVAVVLLGLFYAMTNIASADRRRAVEKQKSQAIPLTK